MNPFNILNVGPQTTAQEIIEAAALALREKRHSARDIAEARLLLMEPELRPVLTFIYFTDIAPLLQPPERAAAPLNADTLRRLEIFD